MQTEPGQAAVPELEIRGLRKLYGDYCAVDDLSLTVAKGEFITILGASGSGKTTTLMMIAGFDYPTAGEILFRGRTITFMPPHLRNIGMVFQSYALFPHLSVFDNIAFPLKLRRVGRVETKARVAAALDLVRLAEHARKRPAQLSGGQQQRIALARALVFGPSLLLMDEPLGALDKSLREQMQLEIKRVQAATGVTILSVTHDQDEALAMSDRIVVMDKGRVEVVGAPLEIYEQPPNRMVAEFLKETNILQGQRAGSIQDAAYIHLPSGIAIRSTHAAVRSAPLGAAVMCCLRPECIRLAPVTAHAFGLPARIRDKIYLGDMVKFHVVPEGTEIELVVKTLASAETRLLTPGDTVRIAWNDDDVLVLAHH
jgi:putative spermidine/putrescine transport system ATP-binding protein